MIICFCIFFFAVRSSSARTAKGLLFNLFSINAQCEFINVYGRRLKYNEITSFYITKKNPANKQFPIYEMLNRYFTCYRNKIRWTENNNCQLTNKYLEQKRIIITLKRTIMVRTNELYEHILRFDFLMNTIIEGIDLTKNISHKLYDNLGCSNNVIVKKKGRMAHYCNII